MDYVRIAEYSQIASSVLFLAVMIWIWVKLIQPAVLTAQQNANARIAQAERHRDEAKAALAGLQADIDAAHGDAQRMKDRVATQSQAEREAVLREAREAGERAVTNAQGEMGRARAAARAQYRDELLERALSMARAQAETRVDATVNQRILSSFLASLERSN